jgi:predicted nucleic acid-binding Zn ribbon protein
VDSGPNRTAGAQESPPPATDLVRSALDEERRMARGRGSGRGTPTGSRRRGRRADLEGRSPGGFSGPAPDESDPQPIGALVEGYVAERGWERPLAEARIFAEWAALVGSDVAAHCAPTTLTAGELKVSAESTAWATQLRLLSSTLLARLAAELGPDVVHRISISGPTGPSWKHGGFSVRGARGPRDTYG